MILNAAYVKKIRDSIRNNPLGDAELRRVVGAGELYMANFETPENQPGYNFVFQYRLKVDDNWVYFFARLRASNEDSLHQAPQGS